MSELEFSNDTIFEALFPTERIFFYFFFFSKFSFRDTPCSRTSNLSDDLLKTSPSNPKPYRLEIYPRIRSIVSLFLPRIFTTIMYIYMCKFHKNTFLQIHKDVIFPNTETEIYIQTTQKIPNPRF